MNQLHTPSQDLSFYYNSKEKRLYVKSKITVNVGDRETLNPKSHTPMNTEASIFHELETLDQATPNQYQDNVLMKLRDKVNVGPGVTKDAIRQIIKEDMRHKGIRHYKVHAKVEIPNTTEVKQNTTTISADDVIEIDD